MAIKALGQHFLSDKLYLEQIIAPAKLEADDVVLEIGPGHGDLTRLLLKDTKKVIAVEYDSNLANELLSKIAFKDSEKLTVISQDIRSFNFSSMDASYKLVANIPYYLTSHLIELISETPNPPGLAVILVQKDVAQRVCEEPGRMSILSVATNLYWETSLGITIPPSAFSPPPKVDSQVLILVRRKKLLFDVDPKIFMRIVKAGFSEKRKTLRNSLSGGLKISKELSEEILDKLKIDSGLRAQELTMEQWHMIYKEFAEKVL